MIEQRPFVFFGKITVLALIVSALPLPQILLDISPFWVLLFFIYWLTYFPTQALFFLALLLGILLDVLQGAVLGQNALALIVSSAFIYNVKQSFFVSNLSTQQVYVFIAAGIYLGLFLLIHVLIQGFNFSYYLLLTPILNSLFWPLVKFILSRWRH